MGLAAHDRPRRMLRQGWIERDRTEVLGQIARLAVAAVGSLIGRLPVGNTGRARVRATEPMPLDAGTARLLDDHGQRIR